MRSKKNGPVKSVQMASAMAVVMTLMFSSCLPEMAVDQAPLGSSGLTGSSMNYDQLAGQYGSRLSPAKAQELDTYLANAMEMKSELESKAGELKIRQAADPIAAATTQAKYRNATRALDVLKASVKQDFVASRGRTSPATENAAESFENSGNEFRQHYAQVSGAALDKSVIWVVLGTLQQVWSAWSSYSEAQRQAYFVAVDQRLKPVSWESL